MSEKTEEPTPKRLRRARDEGDSGASSFAAQAVAFAVVIALVPTLVRALVARTTDDLKAAIARGAQHGGGAALDPAALGVEIVTLTFPVLAVAAVVGAAVHLVQTGGVFSARRLAPKLERLDPFAGLRRLFSAARLFAVMRALIGASLVAWLAYAVLRAHVADLARLSERLGHAGSFVAEVARSLAWDAAMVGLALGAIDVVVVRRGWLRRLRMSKDEVKREQREIAGDPQVKAARARAHESVAAATALASVKSAAVVVVGERHLACALRYDAERDVAPVVVASGDGELAERIASAARAAGVPVVRDAVLARALSELAVGAALPEALFEAVAEILRDTTAPLTR